MTPEALRASYAIGTRDFQAVDLERTDIRGANLYGVNLSRANLVGADMYAVQLRTAQLIEANLRGANLEDANLYGADLTDANLHSANFTGAQMKNVCLDSAWMSGVNLHGARNITRIENCARDGGSLIAVRWDNCIMFQRGCFWGTEDDMIEYLTVREKALSTYWHYLLPEKATLKYWQVMMAACKLALPAE